MGYEWRTETSSWSSVRGYNWEYMDHMFKGASSLEWKAVKDALREINAMKKINKGEILPDRLFTSSGISSTENLEGEYDIIFYAGEYQYERRHYRTAKGILSISSNGGILTGKIVMDPSMEPLDVIPYGGNFTFQETSRIQRMSSYLDFDDETANAPENQAPAGVIKVEAIEYSKDLLEKDNRGNPVTFEGELRIIKEKTPSGVLLDSQRLENSLETWRGHVAFNGVEEATAIVENHRRNTCSWLHNHTVLPEGVARLVGEYRCPPPILFFEEGDLCLDMEWTDGLPSNTSCSCIIARRCSTVATRKRKYRDR